MFIKDPQKKEEIRLGMIEDLESFTGGPIKKSLTYAQVFEAWITEYRKEDGEFRRYILAQDSILQEMVKEESKAPKPKGRPTLEL